MEEPAEKIIVFDAYDTVVQANLVKTKLDAYGIPCFLSEENFTSWYPFRNQLFSGVRLHVFERDVPRVSEVLRDTPLTIDETRCPRCGSSNIFIEESKKEKRWELLTAIFQVLIPAKKIYHCHECENEWD